MTLRRRISVTVASVFSLILALTCTTIFISSAKFREDEFISRLKDRALNTVRLLVEVQEVDNQLLKLIDKNTLNSFLNEKVLVFDETFAPIYSSLDDEELKWEHNDLITLRQDGFLYRKVGKRELIGISHLYQNETYYVLNSAEDVYGKRKLDYLLLILIITFLVGTSLIWVVVLYVIKNLLRPLEVMKDQIIEISANKLRHRIPEETGLQEIKALTEAFNKMIGRIGAAFEAQREFNANASHELRTPLARLTVRIDGMRSKFSDQPEIMTYLNGLTEDVEQLSDLIQSLLLLSRLEKGESPTDLETVRIDELIFTAFDQMKKSGKDADLNFEIEELPDQDVQLEVMGNKSLLQIAFNNLLRNALEYGETPRASVHISNLSSESLVVAIDNDGKVLSDYEQSRLFQPFVRHSNSQHKAGSGLGLRITQRILNYHKAGIKYSSPNGSVNRFTVTFKI
ncbi:HAMP domain-containing sensor histidine kinase [Jiulongibacter sediminis]|jgi:signal transduction histidine kinase|uniref:sensor histidine kinase n=1 Tax=Jiulongibacter sediminis TaxID=1605367 RepID=UPI0026F03770|nr:ATP-binding protein [Jiulongibacter sediminis]